MSVFLLVSLCSVIPFYFVLKIFSLEFPLSPLIVKRNCPSKNSYTRLSRGQPQLNILFKSIELTICIVIININTSSRKTCYKTSNFHKQIISQIIVNFKALFNCTISDHDQCPFQQVIFHDRILYWQVAYLVQILCWQVTYLEKVPFLVNLFPHSLTIAHPTILHFCRAINLDQVTVYLGFLTNAYLYSTFSSPFTSLVTSSDPQIVFCDRLAIKFTLFIPIQVLVFFCFSTSNIVCFQDILQLRVPRVLIQQGQVQQVHQLNLKDHSPNQLNHRWCLQRSLYLRQLHLQYYMLPLLLISLLINCLASQDLRMNQQYSLLLKHCYLIEKHYQQYSYAMIEVELTYHKFNNISKTNMFSSQDNSNIHIFDILLFLISCLQLAVAYKTYGIIKLSQTQSSLQIEEGKKTSKGQ